MMAFPKRGDQVLVELTSAEIYEGTVEYYSDELVEIFDVTCKTMDLHVDTNLVFYKNEIKSVLAIDVDNEKENHIETQKEQCDKDEYVPNGLIKNSICVDDKIWIRLKNEKIFTGEVIYISNDAVELTNTYSKMDNINCYNRIFYYKDVDRWKILNRNIENDIMPKVNGLKKQTKKIKMHLDEFERLTTMTKNYIYINREGESYYSAYNDLINRETIAVVPVGVCSIVNSVSLLLISTFDQIYIFDILLLKMTKEIRDILENEDIIKVIHDATIFYQYYNKQFRKKIKNIFDTQVADAYLRNNRTDLQSLSDCLTHYFNFPSSLLATALAERDSKHWTMSERPFESYSSKLVQASLLVVYLIDLKNLMVRQMLTEYYTELHKKLSILK